MENIDSSKLVNHYFIDYLFASEDFLYPKNKEAYLNHDTVVYSESFNKLLILQPLVVNEDMKFFLWVIDMGFILASTKAEQSVEFFEKMKAEYFFKIPLSFNSAAKAKITYKADESLANLPMDFALNCKSNIVLFHTSSQAFIAEIDLKGIKSTKEISLKQLSLLGSATTLDAIKWHPEVGACLGVLYDNSFNIYDVTRNLDTAEFTLSLVQKKKERTGITFPTQEETTAEEQAKFVDFTFCTKDNLEDFSFLSVVFLNNAGDIFYYCPIFIPKMQLQRSDLDLRRDALKKDMNEESKRYYARLFEYLGSTLNSGNNTQASGSSSKNTHYESLTKNSIQGPLVKIDGGQKKTLKRRQDFVKIYRFPHKKGHVFAIFRASGKVTFLFSLDRIMPNSKSHPFMWDTEAPFRFAVIGKIQLPNFLPELNVANKGYDFVRDNAKIKFVPVKSERTTKVLLSFYNRVYLLHLEWADLIEKALENKTVAKDILKREDYKTNCEVVVDTDPAVIESDDKELKKFKPFRYGYYGFSVIRGNIFVIQTNGEICDYNMVRIVNTSEFGQIKENQFYDNLQLDDSTQDRNRLKQLLKENEANQGLFTNIISDLPPIIQRKKKEKTNDEKQKILIDVDEYVTKVLGMKEGIENSFAQQLELLLIIRGKQESTLQKLQKRAEQLYTKRKNIETNAYKAILERNNQLKERIGKVMTNIRTIVPLSKSDLEAKKNLEDIEKDIHAKREKIKALKEKYAEIKKAFENSQEGSKDIIQGQEIFEEYKNKCKELKNILKNLEEDFAKFNLNKQ